MAEGTLLLAYTDGVTEAQNAAGDFYGQDELIRGVLPACPGGCAGLLTRIVEQVRGFAGVAPQSDDITVLAVRRTVASRPALA